jgi:hypothetical protein
MPKRLTDLQLWTILNAPDLTDANLATVMNVNVATVHGARWRLRRTPWSCTVRYEPCRYCGETATLRGSSRTHAYHAACRPLAERELQRRLDAQREVDPESIRKLYDWSVSTQARTVARATNNGARWTADEEAVVVAHMHRPVEETCAVLGRTMKAVAHRRGRIRRRGRLPC